MHRAYANSIERGNASLKMHPVNECIGTDRTAIASRGLPKRGVIADTHFDARIPRRAELLANRRDRRVLREPHTLRREERAQVAKLRARIDGVEKRRAHHRDIGAGGCNQRQRPRIDSPIYFDLTARISFGD